MDELDFDKKKKKKKKAPAFDEELGGESTTDAAAPEADTAAGTTAAAGDEAKPSDAVPGDLDLALDDLALDGMKKKKKKKTKTAGDVAAEESKPAEEPAAAKADEDDLAFSAPADAPAEDLADEDFSSLKKKKKKKKIADLDDAPLEDTVAPAETTTADTTDYTYEELLEHVVKIMQTKNPDVVAGERRRFVMKPPQVIRHGSKKTAFVNFTEICKILHRQNDHLLGFILAELGTNGSMDGSNTLILKGRFQQKQIENVLRRYIREYVTCHTCKSPDTILAKENRLVFLQCETCNSRCSVSSIKAGFQAVTAKRAAQRAKDG